MAPRLLFVSLTDDVGSERVVIEFGRQGAACAVLGPVDGYASLPRCVRARFPMPVRFGSLGSHFAFGTNLECAVATWRPDSVVPLDDLAATLMRELGVSARAAPALRAVIARSLGAPAGYDAACHRVALMQAAAAAGARTPPFRSAADCRGHGTSALAFPLMVKRDQTSGSGGVVRVGRMAELRAALWSARLKTALKVGLARLGGVPRTATPVLLQSVIEGRLAMFTAACRNGRLIDGIGFEAVESHPTKKSSTVLRAIAHPEMARTARSMVAALGCSGFVSLDFMIDAAGRAFLIELNPRPVGSTHLGRLFGHDLVRAFLTGASAPSRPAIPADTAVALFPKELERDPASRYLALGRTTLFDVPEDEPAVVSAYVAHLKATHPAEDGRLEHRLARLLDRDPALLPAAADTEDLPLAS